MYQEIRFYMHKPYLTNVLSHKKCRGFQKSPSLIIMAFQIAIFSSPDGVNLHTGLSLLFSIMPDIAMRDQNRIRPGFPQHQILSEFSISQRRTTTQSILSDRLTRKVLKQPRKLLTGVKIFSHFPPIATENSEIKSSSTGKIWESMPKLSEDWMRTAARQLKQPNLEAHNLHFEGYKLTRITWCLGLSHTHSYLPTSTFNKGAKDSTLRDANCQLWLVLSCIPPSSFLKMRLIFISEKKILAPCSVLKLTQI